MSFLSPVSSSQSSNSLSTSPISDPVSSQSSHNGLTSADLILNSFYFNQNQTHKKDAKRPKSTFPFGKCKVCSDKATGVHYGIATCEGCKGFFKRSTLRKEKYRCFFGNECPLTPDNRNRCKACRFRRCVDVGMSIQGVKMGRIPKAEKEKALQGLIVKGDVESEVYDLEDDNSSAVEDVSSQLEIEIDSYPNSSEFSGHLENSLKISKDQTEVDDVDTSSSLVEFKKGSSLLQITKSPKNLSIFDLLKLNTPFKSSNLSPVRFHSKFYSSNPLLLDDSYHIISCLLSDKIYQLYIEQNEKVEKLYERALHLINKGITLHDGSDASINKVWDGLLESIPQCVKNLISFSKEIPGLNEVCQKDLTTLVNNRLFDFFIIKHSPLFINGESYMMLPNQIQYTRAWMVKIIGGEMVDKMFEFAEEFNCLNMTAKEIALMYPLVFTEPCEMFVDPGTMSNLNEYYYRAIMYEFDLNRRTLTFVNRWRSLMSKLPELNELQAVRIGGLTPEYCIDEQSR